MSTHPRRFNCWLIPAVAVLLFVAFAASLRPLHAAEGVHYVAPGGNCGEASPCYASVQAAVDAATTGDEIRISGGVYTGVNSYAGLKQIVYLTKTLTLRGGYPISNWSRSLPALYPTVLDAEYAGRVLVVGGTIVPLIENLTLIHGSALGLGGSPRFGDADAGGGVYVLDATVTFSNTVWQEHRAVLGSGGYAFASQLTLVHNTIISNVLAFAPTALFTEGIGGGLFLIDGSHRLVSNTLAGNVSGYGGGLSVYEAYIELVGNVIAGNRAPYHAGGVQLVNARGLVQDNRFTGNVGGYGGGMMMSGDFQVYDNVFTGNTGSWGGGLAATNGAMTFARNQIIGNQAEKGGGMHVRFYGDIELYFDPAPKLPAGNVISGNQAEDGGGLVLEYVDLQMQDNVIANNRAHAESFEFLFDGVGGGLLVNEAIVHLQGDRFIGNQTNGNGGAIGLTQGRLTSLRNVVLLNNEAGKAGSGLWSYGTQVEMGHVTVHANSGATALHTDAPMALTHVIIAGHQVGVAAAATSTVYGDGILWYDNGQDTAGTGTFSLTHTLTGDPAFAPDGYHLTGLSAARDCGFATLATEDLDHESRVDGRPDFGADEFPMDAWHEVYLPTLPLPAPSDR